MVDDKNGISKKRAVLYSIGRIAKKGLRAGLLAGFVLVPACAGCNVVGKWVYQVKTNYGAVVTKWDGKRVAVNEPGWHLRIPLLSTYENGGEQYALANQMLFLHGNSRPHEVITRGSTTKEDTTDAGSVIMAAATTFYEIIDLRQYAIENVKDNNGDGGIDVQGANYTNTPRFMIQRTLDSIIGEHIQKKDPKEIIHNRGAVEREIFEALEQSKISEQYGIKITSFRFTETNYIPKVVEANARKQALVALADGEYAAAQVQKDTIETLAKADAKKYEILEKALNPKTSEEKRLVQEIFQALVKYKIMGERSGDSVWIVEDSTNPSPVYNPR